MKKSLQVCGIIALVLVCGIVGIIGLGAFWMVTAQDMPITEKDQAVVVRASDLLPYFDDYSPSDEYETFEKVRYIDQSWEVNYEYDSPEELEPYISVTVTYERKIQDAKSTYLVEWSAQQLGLNIADGNIDLVEDKTFFPVGDDSRFGNIVYEGETFGHLLVVRKGKTVYAFTITGFTLDDPAIWHELFDHRLAGLESD